FQAEDGIRDFHVTGVQTCALPIFLKRQARNFKKGRDLATAELKEPTLYDRPEVINTVYTAIPSHECQFINGETLVLVASEDGRRSEERRVGKGCRSGWIAVV